MGTNIHEGPVIPVRHICYLKSDVDTLLIGVEINSV